MSNEITELELIVFESNPVDRAIKSKRIHIKSDHFFNFDYLHLYLPRLNRHQPFVSGNLLK